MCTQCLCVYMYVHMCVCVCPHSLGVEVRDQPDGISSLLGIKLGASSLVASTFTRETISLAHPCDTSGLTRPAAYGFPHLCSLPTAVGCPGVCGVVRNTQ